MKRKFLILICFVFIVSMAAVSATDDLNQTDDDTLSVSLNDNEIIQAKDGGTFTDLQKKIDAAPEGSTINLENNYIFVESVDYYNPEDDFQDDWDDDFPEDFPDDFPDDFSEDEFHGNPVKIYKPLTINGNGFTIDGNYLTQIFSIECEGKVVLNNINFINAFGDGCGGSIGAYCDLTVNSCNFKSSSTKILAGGAIYVQGNLEVYNSNFVDNMPKSLTAAGGIDALVHSLEAYVSCMATNYTNSLAIEAIKQIFRYLPPAYEEGANNPKAREKMHNAATIAGMAFANAFLGLCHSMAHKLGAMYNIPHGFANALLLCQVIRFNATDCPKKQAVFPQYKAPEAKKRYAQIAHVLYLGSENLTDDERVELLLQAIVDLKKKIGIPASIREWGIDEKVFMDNLDELSRLAFDDQCTGANPVYPLISDIKQIYLDAYEGKF